MYKFANLLRCDRYSNERLLSRFIQSLELLNLVYLKIFHCYESKNASELALTLSLH